MSKIFGEDSNGNIKAIKTDTAGNLKVNISAGSSEYTDGASSASTGTLVLGATSGSVAQSLLVDSNGRLSVDINSGGGSNASVYVDDADWSATSSSHTLIGGIFQSSEGSITDGDTGPLRLTQNGHVKISADEIGGNTINTNGGNKDTGTLTVTIADNDTNLSAIKTSVELLDNAVDGNYLNVNLNIAGTDVDANSGNKSAATPRVTIATDDTNLSAIKTATDAIQAGMGTGATGEWRASATLNDDTFSEVLEVGNYKNIRAFGKFAISCSIGMPIFGSQTSGGTYYALGKQVKLAQQQIAIGGSNEFHCGVVIENAPKFLKFYNNSGGNIDGVEVDFVKYM